MRPERVKGLFENSANFSKFRISSPDFSSESMEVLISGREIEGLGGTNCRLPSGAFWEVDGDSECVMFGTDHQKFEAALKKAEKKL